MKIYIIAEAGINHNGRIDLAFNLIDKAIEAGADAVKFQTFIAEKEISVYAPKAEYQKKTTNASESQLEMAKKLELNDIAHIELAAYCKQRGIDFLSTPSVIESVDLLSKVLNLPRIKIASGDIVDGPLLLKIAQTRKPIILSTGMSTLGEIEDALSVIAYGYLQTSKPLERKYFREAYFSSRGQKKLRDNVTLLHCTSEYPTNAEDVNLRAINTLKQAFNLPVGFSDHTKGIAIAVAAVACGATVIEKHLTLDKRMNGPDHLASLEPNEFISMVQSIRQVEKAFGHSNKIPAISEVKNIAVARKSLVARMPIRQGEAFDENNLTAKRPGTGISPMSFWDMIGKNAKKNYLSDEIISE